MADYSRKTIKELFGLSMNVCAFREDDGSSACEERLIDKGWDSVKARICHIRARSERGPRYDASMTDKERYAFENLVLLCPTHHVLIDELEPDRFTVEALTKMKNDAIEAAGSGMTWAIRNDALIDLAVDRLIAVMERENSLPPLPPMPTSNPANLEGRVDITSSVIGDLNVGSDRSVVSDSASTGGLQANVTMTIGGPSGEVTTVGGPGASLEHEVIRGAYDELSVTDSATIAGGDVNPTTLHLEFDPPKGEGE